MTQPRAIKRWYRCLRDDGTLWCETSSQRECVEQGMLSDSPVHYEQMTVFSIEGPWEPFTPSEVLLKEAAEYTRLLQEELEMEE